MNTIVCRLIFSPGVDDNSHDKTRVQLYSQGTYFEYQPASLILKSAEPNNPQNTFPVGWSNVCLDISSSEMTNKIQGWIDRCLKDHADCLTSDVTETFVPKRLIHVDQHSCSLFSFTSPVRYAALGYCWGSIKQSSTTKDNVTLRYGELQCQQLPQTIQDAIMMTLKLGLSYIWVNSICIIQDDRDDWAEQAASMADIYSSAYIVLAATGVSKATDGFLHQRSRPMELVSFLNDTERPITVSARVVNNHDLFNVDVDLDDQPLSERGWALQERVLAARTVHFLPDEVMFECRSGMACECRRRPTTNNATPSWPPENEGSPENIYLWTRLVESFKGRSLTYSSDTLPAISGIAQRTLALDPGRYFAGLWEQGIANQLGYRGKGSQTVATELQGTRPHRSRPTCTWATFPGSVQFEGKFDKPICTLIGGQVQPMAGDIFGQVKEGYLQLQGRSIPGSHMVRKIFTTTPRLDNLKSHSYHCSTRVYLDRIGVFRTPERFSAHRPAYEGLDVIQDWSAVVCFGLVIENEFERLTMLLLEPSHEGDSYVRVGLVANFPVQWFDEFASESIVTII